MGIEAVPCARLSRRAGRVVAWLGVALTLVFGAHNESFASPGAPSPLQHADVRESDFEESQLPEYSIIIGESPDSDTAKRLGLDRAKFSRADLELRGGVLMPHSDTYVTATEFAALARDLDAATIRAQNVVIEP